MSELVGTTIQLRIAELMVTCYERYRIGSGNGLCRNALVDECQL
jgi:hypothetical protein